MKEKNKKLISALLIVLVIAPAVLFSRPKEVKAQWLTHDIPNAIINIVTASGTTINTGNTVANFFIALAKQVIMVIEKRLLQEFTKGITGWINTGFHGSPLFLTNSDSFFKDIAKTEIKTIVSEFGYDPNRFPYGQDFALSVINRYKAAADADAAYSLSAVMSPQMATNYRNNFNAGGWNGFLINTQYPQNNYLGFNFLANDKLARQLQGTTQTAAQKIQTTLNQGMGFLSPQTCPSNPKYNNGTNEFQKPVFKSDVNYEDYVPSPVYEQKDAGTTSEGEANDTTCTTSECEANIQSNTVETPASIKARAIGELNYEDDVQAEKATFDETNTCPKGLVSTTPGSVAANQIFKALGVNADATALGSMVEGSLSAILNSLVSHFLDQGLNALGDAINGSSSTTDSWSYQGNTLVTNTAVNSAGVNTGTSATLSLSPASVSVFPGNAVNNITISGGTPPYLLLGTCDSGQGGATQNVTRASCSATTSGAGAWNPANPQFAIASASDAGVTVIGVAVGNTSVTIQDSSIPAKTITLPITITGTDTSIIPTGGTPTDNTVGDCLVSGATRPVSITKSDCDLIKGSWSPTAAVTSGPLGVCTATGIIPGGTTPSTIRDNTTQANCTAQNGVNGVTTTWVALGSCTITEPTTKVETTTQNETFSTCDAIGGVFTPYQ